MLEEVRLPTSSDASDVRCFAAEAGRRSLFFFMTALCELPASPDVCEFLQTSSARVKVVTLSLREALAYAEAFVLWTALRGLRSDVRLVGTSRQIDFVAAAKREALCWLYGPLSIPEEGEETSVVFLIESRVKFFEPAAEVAA